MDITNIHFFRTLTTSFITAIKFVEKGPSNESRWLFKCNCGKESIKNAVSVKRGLMDTCGDMIIHNKTEPKDITGQKFNRLTALHFSHRKNHTHYWIFRCDDCQKEKIMPKKSITSLRVKNCGCKILTDYTNQKFNSLTGIKHIKMENNQNIWLWKCDCGKEKEIPSTHVTSENTKTCGNHQAIGESHPLWEGFGKVSGQKLSCIRHRAKEHNREFDVDAEFLNSLFEKQNGKCALTGKDIFLPSKNTEPSTASLDRIDSSKGYTKNNVQWLHKDINWIKNDYSESEFLEMCQSVISYKNKKAAAQRQRPEEESDYII